MKMCLFLSDIVPLHTTRAFRVGYDRVNLYSPLSLNPSPTQAGRGTLSQVTPLSPRLRGGKGLGDRGVIDLLRKVSDSGVGPILPAIGFPHVPTFQNSGDVPDNRRGNGLTDE